MPLSIFDLYKVGIGPSSSHTVGPVVAANRFLDELRERGDLLKVANVKVGLYGSLAMTGKGHATDVAVMIGLLGEKPDLVDPDMVPRYIEQIEQTGQLNLAGETLIEFIPEQHLPFNFGESLPKHPNGMRFQAFDAAGIVLHDNIFYSVGGGFVLSDDEADKQNNSEPAFKLPYHFNNGAELLALCEEHDMTIAELVQKNELHWHTPEELKVRLQNIWQVKRWVKTSLIRLPVNCFARLTPRSPKT